MLGPMQAATTLDALDVLLRGGAERDAFLAALPDDEAPGVDAALVSDVLRVAGRVAQTVGTRRALVGLCAILRALDAALEGRIDLAELRSGIASHAAASDGFAAFDEARVLLRTIAEILREDGRIEASSKATLAQLRLLDSDLRQWTRAELLGDASAPGAGGETPVEADPLRVHDASARARHDALVEELLHGSSYGPVTGLLGAAWVRDWSAVPVPGERVDEEVDALERLLDAARGLGGDATPLLRIDRQRGPRWQVVGQRLTVLDGLRPSWAFAANRAQAASVLGGDRRGWCVVTNAALDFAVVEGPGHHALLGPRPFVEHVLGMSTLEGVAAFREHVERAAVDGEPPADLLEVARSFGRLRRRSR